MNDFPRHAYRSGQADGDHARSRIDPDDAERLTGIYRSDGRTPGEAPSPFGGYLRGRGDGGNIGGARMPTRAAGQRLRMARRGSGFDANWLTGEVELQAGRTGVFHARHGAALRTEELAQFRDQLQEVVASLNGTATLHHLESQVGCTVELANGRGNLSAFIKEHVGSDCTFMSARPTSRTWRRQCANSTPWLRCSQSGARRPSDVTPSGSAATGVLDRCQGHSQLPTRGDKAGTSAQQTATAGRSWTVRPLLRNRCSAANKRPGGTCQVK